MEATSPAAKVDPAEARALALQICKRMSPRSRQARAWAESPRWLKRVACRLADVPLDIADTNFANIEPQTMAVVRLSVRTLLIEAKRLGDSL